MYLLGAICAVFEIPANGAMVCFVGVVVIIALSGKRPNHQYANCIFPLIQSEDREKWEAGKFDWQPPEKEDGGEG